MMPRDSGRIYAGELVSTGIGKGALTIKTEEGVCTGPASRIASNESFSLINTYGPRGASVSALSSSGDVRIRALLSCPNGGALRCEITGRDGNGGGLCLDNSSKVFDLIVQR
jgi:hypothetical protein